ncbi:MAG: glycosyltransferase family 2 protein [Desulfamplus sp.]|nr:glycosyltransferase family 2 protein [Desulfamplus sp.]
MYKNKTVCVVIPCYNEGTQIESVINTMPDYVDKIVAVDDKSQDNTIAVIQKCQAANPKLVLIALETNQGCGGALAAGYKWARDNNMDMAVRMDGDGQMCPNDLPHLLEPVAEDRADYTKGNRLFTGEAFQKIPRIRYFGNGILSLLTKIASGYWHIADSQSGYTVINKMGLHAIDWDRMYKRYGQPNDILVRLNVENMRVMDVPVEPVYNVGEKSGIKIHKVIFTIGWLLVKLFFWRMKEKYIIRDFHPLVFFYFLGGTFGVITFFLFYRLFIFWLFSGYILPINALSAMFSFMSASQFTLFAMWFDMEANKELKGVPKNEEFLRVQSTEKELSNQLKQDYLFITNACKKEKVEKEAALKEKEAAIELTKKSIAFMQKKGSSPEEIAEILNIPLEDVLKYK